MFSCACSCDADGPEFYADEIRKARVPHFCSECGEVIEPGDKYEHVRGKWDDSMSTYCTCEFCLKVRQDMCGSCWVFTRLWEDVSEVWDGPLAETGVRMFMYENDEEWCEQNNVT